MLNEYGNSEIEGAGVVMPKGECGDRCVTLDQVEDLCICVWASRRRAYNQRRSCVIPRVALLLSLNALTSCSFPSRPIPSAHAVALCRSRSWSQRIVI